MIASTGLFLWSAAIEGRLVYLQVIAHDELVSAAENQQSRTIPAPAKRGDIFDRNGRLLAYSVDADSVFAVPSEISNPDETAAALCVALRDCTTKERAELTEKLSKRKPFAYVKRRISPQQAERIAALKLDAILFRTESRRYYPNSELAAHLLGYVGTDNEGLGGIEHTYDHLIRGEQGKVLVQVDAHHRPFSRVEKPPTTGGSLELTIDEHLQYVAERELRAGVETSGAAGGSAIVMDPFTGEILALANYPTFNPNAFGRFKDDFKRNRAVQDLYEPGSTFKIVTAGAALEEKLLQPTDLINTSPGVIRFGSRVIDEDKGHNYGVLSVKDVIVKSSNVGAIKIGLRIGPDRLGAYVKRFGFGRPLSPDFRGESPGIVWDAARLTDSALASVSMGYQVGVTPLQMAVAASSVANGGELIEPRVVRAVIRNGVRQPVPRKVLGRTISLGTAKQLTEIMEGVVTDGTGKKAQVDGYTIAGKTGTASKVVNGRYSRSDYNVSFVGFLPSRDPVFTIIVVVDSPHKAPPYGGTVAAPVFQRIAEAALRHRGVPRTLLRPAPVLVARNDDVHEQPTSGPVDPASIVTIAGELAGTGSVFPDVVGMNARDAVRVLVRLGLSPRLTGAGFVVDQQPPAGTPLDATETVTLSLSRRARVEVASTSGQAHAGESAPVGRGTR